jgi:predicted Zn-dependent protease
MAWRRAPDPARPRRLLAPLLALALSLGCAGGAAAPPAGQEDEKPIILRTEEDDRRAGAEAAKEVAESIGVVQDAALNRYVDQVGQRVARNAPRGDFSYSFQVVDQDEPNAFALPGGYIYVSRGLLAMANSEDELANVLGHEIVHVARRHAAARQNMMGALPGIFRYAAMGQAAAYGREQESESDRLGQGLAALAGYDPEGMARFLIQLEASERLRLGFSRIQGYLDSHPTTQGRVAAAGARARTISWTRRPGIAKDRADYLSRMDGLVIGIGAAEGVIQGTRFLHADMGFSINFPSGWKVINTRSAVGALSPDHRAQVALEFQGPGEDPEAAANEYMEEYASKGLRIERLQHVRIAGLPAVRALGRASSPRAPIALHLTWIARDGMILRLTGATIGRGGLEGVFNNVARSFRPITQRELASIRETRLRVVEARAGEALVDFSRRTRNEWNIQQTAVMNGIFADARLGAGQLMKVAISQPYSKAR